MTKTEALERKLKDFIVSTSWSHKYLIAQFDLDSGRASIIKRFNSVCTAITAGGLMTNPLWNGNGVLVNILQYILIASSLASVITNGAVKSDAMLQRLQGCRTMANDYCELRDSCRSLLYDLYSGGDLDEIETQFKELQAKCKEYNRKKPAVSEKARKKAETRLKKYRDDDYREDYHIMNLEG